MSPRRLLLIVSYVLVLCAPVFAQTSEYLWYEAENMRGFSLNERYEPVLNPSWVNPLRAKAPGWGINGPGVSAEWSQGGESEWNSAAASADETKAALIQDVEIARAGKYKFWVRYADWASKNENFTVRVVQAGRELFRREFGAGDLLDPHDETKMYWGWAFAWDGAEATLNKGAAQVFIEIEKAAQARRHVDCWLLTNDLAFTPQGRRKPDFAAWRVLREGRPVESLLTSAKNYDAPALWQQQLLAGRDFVMPWNTAREFWRDYDKPPAERSLYPFHAEPIEEFVKKYAGQKDVPLFGSKLAAPVVYINDLPEYLKEGSAFLRYARETKTPFAVLINYGAANFADEAAAQAAWKLLDGELRGQFLGWISGESVGYVWDKSATQLKINPQMSRRELMEAHRVFYTNAIADKWQTTFRAPTGAQWDKLMPAQSTSSTSFAHALAEWGVRDLGLETATVQPGFAMRLAFTRGAARQFGRRFWYYHAPNFGDSATTFTKTQNFAGPDNFWHSRYGATMGPSLSWYRKSLFFYYMSGASAIYLEQGYDQFFKPGPGEHPFQLNPLGRISDEFVKFAEKHPERGAPYTPIAFLLDPAHGWEMTDYPHYPFGVSPISRHDGALRELFGAAYFPLPETEGEPATGDRQAYVNGVFGDIFDVLVASDARPDALDAYRAVIVGGRVQWSKTWAAKLRDYVQRGGVVMLNAAQVEGLPADLLGVEVSKETGETDTARSVNSQLSTLNSQLNHNTKPSKTSDLGGKRSNYIRKIVDSGQLTVDSGVELRGPVFRYHKIAPRTGVKVIATTLDGAPLATVNEIGRGRVVFVAVPDLLGLDERLTPLAAHLLKRLCTEATPVRVVGDAEYLVNRTTRGWLVTLLNNRGIYKPQQGLAEVRREESVEIMLSLRIGTLDAARELTNERRLALTAQNGVTQTKITIPAGGLAIVELLERR